LSSLSSGFERIRLLQGGDESLPYCKKHLDGYTETKEKAERIVLEANGRKGLLTVALRPSGIFGPGDAQGWPGFIEAAQNGKSKFQLGNGCNLIDWTYVENVAYAHVLAADRLVPGNDSVAGQAFFITNGEPAPFWDMAKYIWSNLDYPVPTVVVPYWLAYYLALLLDWIVLRIFIGGVTSRCWLIVAKKHYLFPRLRLVLTQNFCQV